MHLWSLIILFTVIFAIPGKGQQGSEDYMHKKDNEEYFSMRQNMVEQQIKSRGVQDTLVLKAMLKVKRHRFVPDNLKRFAYADEPLPIGHSQTISQPYIVAYMTEALDLKKGDKVLEIGTGSGYQAAILAEITDQVYTIEIIAPLGEKAKKILKEEGYDYVHCLIGDGYRGWPDHAPFDAIIITAAPPHIPQPLIEQLAEGGRMIVPVGEWYQELILLTKTEGEVKEKRLIPVRFVPMTGEVQKKNKL